MEAIESGGRPAPISALGRLGLLGLLLLFLGALTLRLGLSGARGVDRVVRPDAIEYAALAESLGRGQGLRLALEGALLPPCSPPGVPLALAPFAAPLGARWAWIGCAVWSSLAVLLCTWTGWRLAGRRGALLAGLVSLTAPSSVASAGISMGESIAQALVALALLAAFQARPPRVELGHGAGPRLGWLAWGGLAIAWAVNVRLTLLALLLPGLAAALPLTLRRPGAAGQAGPDPAASRPAGFVLRPLALAVGLPLLGLLGLHVWQYLVFGDWTRTGYHLWAPEVYEQLADLVLSPRWLFDALPGQWTNNHLREYGLGVLGLEADWNQELLWSFPVAMLAGLGWLSALRRWRRDAAARTLVSAGLAALAVLGFHLFYFWQDLRFIEPLLPLTCAAAVWGTRSLLERAQRHLPRVPQGLLFALLCVLALWPQIEDLYARWRWEQHNPRSLCVSLEDLKAKVPAEGLVLINFPLCFARESLGPEQALMFLDVESADVHMARAAKFGLRDGAGRQPQCSALCMAGQVNLAGLRRVQTALFEGQPVLLLRAAFYGREGPGFERLSAAGVRLRPLAQVGPLELLQLEPPAQPAPAAELGR